MKSIRDTLKTIRDITSALPDNRCGKMIEKTVAKKSLHDLAEIRQNLVYWLSKSPQERLAALERIRRDRHGSAERLQRIARAV